MHSSSGDFHQLFTDDIRSKHPTQADPETQEVGLGWQKHYLCFHCGGAGDLKAACPQKIQRTPKGTD